MSSFSFVSVIAMISGFSDTTISFSSSDFPVIPSAFVYKTPSLLPFLCLLEVLVSPGGTVEVGEERRKEVLGDVVVADEAACPWRAG